MTELTSLPVPVLAGLGVLVLVELGLMIVAILDWVKRPAERMRGNRVAWLLVILLLNIIGPLVYLFAGRLADPANESGVVGSQAAAGRAADMLYGPAAGSRDDARNGADAS